MANKQQRFEALVYALHSDLFRYAFWLVHDKSVAEDLVQETFLRAWRSLDSLADERAAKSWLITILRRENARRFERKQLPMGEYDETQIIDQLGTNNERNQEQHWLQQRIASLAIEYREPLILQVLWGYSTTEISDILELNKNTVMTRLFRARKQLKDAIEQNQQVKGHQHG
ncbi:sigma-70 family RNA polymerase sigma factor [Thalassotalea ponticola]|uniref:sigma-70 family RNA polymerase sigma factor n=1 Tax=Thalassotalea ponticola TaxID=1523392 RepID=UPI0025B2A39C|nr:sigma-70 family RNA polymerase sigma factor [Thalassotalea ponticola]MDN3651650.1 sigma-70 family RNA polymerase sigma factor [Thalassotalea ponticola]